VKRAGVCSSFLKKVYSLTLAYKVTPLNRKFNYNMTFLKVGVLIALICTSVVPKSTKGLLKGKFSIFFGHAMSPLEWKRNV